MRPVRYLLSKIRQYNPGMLGVITCNTLLASLYPFIWVFHTAAFRRMRAGTTTQMKG